MLIINKPAATAAATTGPSPDSTVAVAALATDPIDDTAGSLPSAEARMVSLDAGSPAD